MASTLCISCKKLISTEEKNCPYCEAPQAGASVIKLMMNSSQYILTFFIGVNVFLYIFSLIYDIPAALSMEHGILGIGAPKSEFLFLLGMTGGPAWTCGHYWTLISASFLHGSILHILFNMQWLKQLGQMIAAFLGPIRLINIYVITGIGGFLLSNVWSNSPTIGASCSIFGIMGVLITFTKRRGGSMADQINSSIWSNAIFLLILGFVIPMVNNAGHIGGFLSGLAMGYILPDREGVRTTLIEKWLAIIFLISIPLSIGMSVWNMWDIVINKAPFLCYG